MIKKLNALCAGIVIATTTQFAAGAANAEQAPPWPERWLAAGIEFGTLKVEFRLHDGRPRVEHGN